MERGRALAVETSGRVGSVALVENGAVVAEEQFPHGLKHAAEMVPMIDRLCRGRGWAAEDLSELYVSAGPGSFTGLRIGITLAKTMAFATGLRIVAVPTVRVLAENAPGEAERVLIVLDAKRGQIFTALFERAGEDWVERQPAHLDSLAGMLGRCGRPIYLIGEGIPYHVASIPPGDAGVIVAPEPTWRARASAVASVGMELSRRGDYADPDRLTPIYIRRPEAEEKRLAAEQSPGA
jgi:tRNA threonylcarbamoyladenosine biosynthesis protein TsaB